MTNGERKIGVVTIFYRVVNPPSQGKPDSTATIEVVGAEENEYVACKEDPSFAIPVIL